MDDPSNPINGEKGLTSLQIDCDLESSASLTWASTLTTPFTTPKSDRTGNVGDNSSNIELSSEWVDFYNRLNRTPPKAARTAQFQNTLTTANALLKLSDDPDFQDKPFDQLTDDQQAILMLMIMKGMDTIFGGSRQQSAKILIKALNPNSMEYKRMMSFVRKEGDTHYRAQSLLTKQVLQTAQTFAVAKNAITIFKDRPNMSPFLHFQRAESYVCTYNASSALLYYCSQKNNGKNDDEKIPALKMNISRYIRDEVPGLEIANFTLTSVKGAFLDRVLLALMKSFGTSKCDDVVKIDIWGQNEEENFSTLKGYLEKGRPFVFVIECFPGLEDKKRMKYTGKAYRTISNERPKDPNDRFYHALLCIGIKPREGTNLPPLLLVQDSCPTRPIFEIGLDLLMDLGMEDLHLCTVPGDWTFNKKMDYMVSPETKALICGSPMSIDDKGVPRIIKAETTAQVQRDDMSRYLDVMVLEPGEVGFAYMT